MMERHNIRLERVNRLNWQACSALSVTESQKPFVPSNLYSIAEAQFYPDACPLVVYNRTDQMVGFALYGRDTAGGHWKIFRLMVDAAFQGQGYGSQILAALVSEIAAKPDAQAIMICYHAANTTAREIYIRCGFREQSTHESGVTTAMLNVSR